MFAPEHVRRSDQMIWVWKGNHPEIVQIYCTSLEPNQCSVWQTHFPPHDLKSKETGLNLLAAILIHLCIKLMGTHGNGMGNITAAQLFTRLPDSHKNKARADCLMTV